MAYLSKGFLIEFFFFLITKLVMSLFQFVHYWALYAPSRRFDINSRLKKLSFFLN